MTTKGQLENSDFGQWTAWKPRPTSSVVPQTYNNLGSGKGDRGGLLQFFICPGSQYWAHCPHRTTRQLATREKEEERHRQIRRRQQQRERGRIQQKRERIQPLIHLLERSKLAPTTMPTTTEEKAVAKENLPPLPTLFSATSAKLLGTRQTTVGARTELLPTLQQLLVQGLRHSHTQPHFVRSTSSLCATRSQQQRTTHLRQLPTVSLLQHHTVERLALRPTSAPQAH